MVYCTGLENRRTERFRGFESRSLRHSLGMKGFSKKSGRLRHARFNKSFNTVPKVSDVFRCVSGLPLS